MATVPADTISGSVRASLESGRNSRVLEVAFKLVLASCLGICLLVLVVLAYNVLSDGLGSLSLSFLTETPSRVIPENSGIGPALAGTLWLMGVCALFVIPTGVATAIYLEEYANRERWLNRFIELNIQNLAAVPSSSRRARRSARCPRPSARARWRLARRSGRQSGSRRCRPRCPESRQA